MMLPVLRRRHILGELANTGVVEARELSTRLGVSAITIRRDLEIMDRQGQLTRVRGGAVAAPGTWPVHRRKHSLEGSPVRPRQTP
jgi:DeoR/GlpR family transcriptional regulator of sugar metabolism